MKKKTAKLIPKEEKKEPLNQQIIIGSIVGSLDTSRMISFSKIAEAVTLTNDLGAIKTAEEELALSEFAMSLHKILRKYMSLSRLYLEPYQFMILELRKVNWQNGLKTVHLEQASNKDRNYLIDTQSKFPQIKGLKAGEKMVYGIGSVIEHFGQERLARLVDSSEFTKVFENTNQYGVRITFSLGGNLLFKGKLIDHHEFFADDLLLFCHIFVSDISMDRAVNTYAELVYLELMALLKHKSFLFQALVFEEPLSADLNQRHITLTAEFLESDAGEVKTFIAEQVMTGKTCSCLYISFDFNDTSRDFEANLFCLVKKEFCFYYQNSETEKEVFCNRKDFTALMQSGFLKLTALEEYLLYFKLAKTTFNQNPAFRSYIESKIREVYIAYMQQDVLGVLGKLFYMFIIEDKFNIDDPLFEEFLSIFSTGTIKVYSLLRIVGITKKLIKATVKKEEAFKIFQMAEMGVNRIVTELKTFIAETAIFPDFIYFKHRIQLILVEIDRCHNIRQNFDRLILLLSNLKDSLRVIGESTIHLIFNSMNKLKTYLGKCFEVVGLTREANNILDFEHFFQQRQSKNGISFEIFASQLGQAFPIFKNADPTELKTTVSLIYLKTMGLVKCVDDFIYDQFIEGCSTQSLLDLSQKMAVEHSSKLMHEKTLSLASQSFLFEHTKLSVNLQELYTQKEMNLRKVLMNSSDYFLAHEKLIPFLSPKMMQTIWNFVDRIQWRSDTRQYYKITLIKSIDAQNVFNAHSFHQKKMIEVDVYYDFFFEECSYQAAAEEFAKIITTIAADYIDPDPSFSKTMLIRVSGRKAEKFLATPSQLLITFLVNKIDEIIRGILNDGDSVTLLLYSPTNRIVYKLHCNLCVRSSAVITVSGTHEYHEYFNRIFFDEEKLRLFISTFEFSHFKFINSINKWLIKLENQTVGVEHLKLAFLRNIYTMEEKENLPLLVVYIQNVADFESSASDYYVAMKMIANLQYDSEIDLDSLLSLNAVVKEALTNLTDLMHKTPVVELLPVLARAHQVTEIVIKTLVDNDVMGADLISKQQAIGNCRKLIKMVFKLLLAAVNFAYLLNNYVCLN